MIRFLFVLIFFFFNDTATTEIYTLSLHDALPILSMKSSSIVRLPSYCTFPPVTLARWIFDLSIDRKSTRLNSSHGYISYAVFCLKKKKKLDIGQQEDSWHAHVQ